MKSEKLRTLKKKMQNYSQSHHLKIEQNLIQNNNQQRFQQLSLHQNSSQANWQIENVNNVNNVSNNDNISRCSNQQDVSNKSIVKHLCKAVSILRSKMPERSLQQIIIRLKQAAQIKRDLSNQGQLFSDYMNQLKSVSNFEEKQGEESHELKKQGDLKSNYTYNRYSSQAENFDKEKSLSSAEGIQAETGHPLRSLGKQINEKQQSFQKNANFQQSNYIYRPKGQQIVMQLQIKDTLKTKFVNIQQQSRYKQQRIVAQALVNRGYGVCQCRKEIQAQNINLVMKRDNYKKVSISVATFAFRKLESFLTIECKKKLKFIDRHQMQVISINLLHCRSKLQPQHVTTVHKYVKACYGIGDVIIGQIESVKLYLTFQKYLYGKNVTMEFLERIGEIYHKKEIQQTLVYINNRTKRYQQRLITLRQRRIQKNRRKLMNSENKNEETINKALEVKVQSTQNQQCQNQKSFICEIFQNTLDNNNLDVQLQKLKIDYSEVFGDTDTNNEDYTDEFLNQEPYQQYKIEEELNV